MTTVQGLDGLRAIAGEDLGYSAWRTIDQDRINAFADTTDDHQWIHVDTARAAAGPFGGTIAHGYLTLSLLVPMFFEVLQVEGVAMGINYGLNKVRFPSPVPVGSRIRLAATLADVTDVADGVQITADCTITVEGADKPACAAQIVFRYYS